jgi:hypothetical protein
MELKMRNYVIIFLLISIITMFCGCAKKNTLEIINKESYYSNYIIDGDKVYIECELAFNNLRETETTIELYADFPDDVELGLLKNAKIMGYHDDLLTSTFSLPEGKTRIFVVFIGDFAGTNQKHDRNLPNITIVQNEAEQ